MPNHRSKTKPRLKPNAPCRGPMPMSEAEGPSLSQGDGHNLSHAEIIDLGRPSSQTIIPQEVKNAIIDEALTSDRSHAEIAVKYQVSVGSVNNIVGKFKREASKARALSEESAETFHKKIRHKAIKAVVAGLDCNKDPYRRAAVGVKVMEGIGEFKRDGMQINNFNIVASTPAQFRDRYLGLESENKEMNHGDIRHEE